ncbi:RNA polymerase sigma factor [Glaciihabitans sp. UYNi722]|uniref:RNA polymerase sigma factor n=1 Tax=Glaciihabitans sp. UYNi722 TaxID=3156344 RepID=UPI0033989689
MQDQDSDETLWSRVLGGEEEPFGVLFDRHRRSIFQHAYARTFDRTEAEDAVAIVYFEAWRHGRKVRFIEGSILPWLLAVTAHVTQNLQRSRRRYTRLLASLPSEEAAADDPIEDAGTHLDLEREWHQIAEKVRKLSPLDQAIVELCLVRELSTAEVATTLGIPTGTLKSRLSRVRAKLRGEHCT